MVPPIARLGADLVLRASRSVQAANSRGFRRRSADLQSAVSPNCIRRRDDNTTAFEPATRRGLQIRETADYKSALRLGGFILEHRPDFAANEFTLPYAPAPNEIQFRFSADPRHHA